MVCRTEGAECLTKATPLLEAIGACLAPDDASSDDRLHRAEHFTPARRAPRPTPRPDPENGVFETLLVMQGKAVALGGHLERLEHSARTLYHQRLPSDLAVRIQSLAAPITGRARLRVNARPAPDRTAAAVEIVISEAPVRIEPTRLAPVVVPGGIGPHKWIDRRLIDAVSASIAPAHPVICDIDGTVLETSRANVFIVTPDGTIVTPPADGRILPGVTRAAVLQAAAEFGIETEIRDLPFAELLTAPEVFLTGSLSGIEPARTPGYDGLPGAGNLTELLRTNLYKTTAPAIRH